MSSAGRVVLITGAAGNLGRAVVRAFADQGAPLLLIGRNVSQREVHRPVPAEHVRLVAVDLVDRAQVLAAMASLDTPWQHIGTVCHLAGGFDMGEPVHETGDRTWDFLMDLNARSFLNIAAATVPLLLRHGGGSIVTVGASAATRGAAHMGAYAASKSALLRLTESMSHELGRHGIRVNCVLPSILRTAENRAAMPDADHSSWVAPEALADVISFLASDRARAIHGATIPVTGSM